MGAQAISALAVVVLPFGLPSKTEDTLFQIMSGACEALGEAKCALVGGHTCEGTEMALGFAINGLTQGAGSEMRKGGMAVGEKIILTKPIGTGVLFAARMRNEARGRWVSGALKAMTTSNAPAANLARDCGASACTDVTGFGLLGHAAEMCKASNVALEINVNAVPCLQGAVECVEKGIFSSLQPANLRLKRAVDFDSSTNDALHGPKYSLLFDPQTAGGLLLTLPEDQVDGYLEDVRAAGCAEAAVIGSVIEPLPKGQGGAECIRLVC